MSAQREPMETDEPIQEVEENEVEEEGVREGPQEEEAEAEVEEEEAEGVEEEEEEEEEEISPDNDQLTEESAPVKKKPQRKEAAPLKREPGKSLLPFSRVQKIIKADKVCWLPRAAFHILITVQEIPVIARDAVFLVSLATEAFIAELAQAAQRVAEKERRTTVQQKDIGVYSLARVCPLTQGNVAVVVRKADEFMFLEGMNIRPP